jgi:hypothetical protein
VEASEKEVAHVLASAQKLLPQIKDAECQKELLNHNKYEDE